MHHLEGLEVLSDNANEQPDIRTYTEVDAGLRATGGQSRAVHNRRLETMAAGAALWWRRLGAKRLRWHRRFPREKPGFTRREGRAIPNLSRRNSA